MLNCQKLSMFMWLLTYPLFAVAVRAYINFPSPKDSDHSAEANMCHVAELATWLNLPRCTHLTNTKSASVVTQAQTQQFTLSDFISESRPRGGTRFAVSCCFVLLFTAFDCCVLVFNNLCIRLLLGSFMTLPLTTVLQQRSSLVAKKSYWKVELCCCWVMGLWGLLLKDILWFKVKRCTLSGLRR